MFDDEMKNPPDPNDAAASAAGTAADTAAYNAADTAADAAADTAADTGGIWVAPAPITHAFTPPTAARPASPPPMPPPPLNASSPQFAPPPAGGATPPDFVAPQRASGAPSHSVFDSLPSIPPASPPNDWGGGLGSPASASTKRGRSKNRGSSAGRWLLLALLGVLLVGGGYFIGTNLGQDSAANPVEAADAPAVLTPQDEAADEVVVDAPAIAQPTPLLPTPIPPIDEPAQATEPIVFAAGLVSPSVVSLNLPSGSSGSGIIYTADGHIVTNAHVVGSDTTATVILSSGLQVSAQVIGADAETDVAVIKIDEGVDVLPASFARADSVQVGQTAIAIGSPFGLTQSVTAGIVSAARRPVEGQLDSAENTVVPMIQTDAPINPGNSGGALVDRHGQVIGMNTLIRTASGAASSGNIGLGFAIPSDIVVLIADGIISGEPVTPSVLGVGGRAPDLGEQPGALLDSITAGGAADLAGLQVGDLVVTFDGVSLRSMRDLAAVVRLSPSDIPLTVQIVRNGDLLSVPVLLQTR